MIITGNDKERISRLQDQLAAEFDKPLISQFKQFICQNVLLKVNLCNFIFVIGKFM